MTNYVKFLSHHITEDVKTDTENTKTDKNSEAYTVDINTDK